MNWMLGLKDVKDRTVNVRIVIVTSVSPVRVTRRRILEIPSMNAT